MASSAPRRSRPRHRGRAASAGTSVQRAGGEREADRQVDEEDRAPVDELGQRAAQQHADRGAGAADRAPDAERLGALAALGRWSVMIDSAAGESIAAPRPCAARAANSVAASPASAEASDATVNTPRPARKTRRRPSRSAARPPSSSRLPKISE